MKCRRCGSELRSIGGKNFCEKCDTFGVSRVIASLRKKITKKSEQYSKEREKMDERERTQKDEELSQIYFEFRDVCFDAEFYLYGKADRDDVEKANYRLFQLFERVNAFNKEED